MLIGDVGDGHAGQLSVLHGDHSVVCTLRQQLDRLVSELCRQDAIARRRLSAALDVAEDGGAAFEFGSFGHPFVDDFADASEADGIR